ncbi:MAG: family 1 glycosylhydrolase [Microthrixaceae bacterium]|nr:family 1 glycosylhydrolase [Microthrixaceae bacterium]
MVFGDGERHGGSVGREPRSVAGKPERASSPTIRPSTDADPTIPRRVHLGHRHGRPPDRGGNWNNDWWAFQHTAGSGVAEPSGDACDSWNRWADDADVVQAVGLDNYRFSLEWSRIEPEDGEWSIAALDHYARLCDGLRARGWTRGHLPPLHLTEVAGRRGGWSQPRRWTASPPLRACRHPPEVRP